MLFKEGDIELKDKKGASHNASQAKTFLAKGRTCANT